ncbi:unnamed protein product [Phytophthora fragariaefolia]|uniref:Unnamed protein product n=1 Tax=Phytophthora fragariaefolia TaxID=1490495 RepID=A0A9W6YB70_9STRA|nr:unnamed protein product [Phytophthora fragariaefolia]
MAKVDSTRTDYLTHAEEFAHFAQAWEIETKKKNVGKELVGAPAKVVMTALETEAEGARELSADVQQGTLLDFHKRLGHLNYDSVEKLARDPSSGIALTDPKRLNCLTCAEGKQSKGKQSRKDSGANSPIERIGGVICSDLKGPMTPKDRLGNRYMVNFVDHKSNYLRVFLAKTKDQAAKKFEHFLVFFETEFNTSNPIGIPYSPLFLTYELTYTGKSVQYIMIQALSHATWSKRVH